MLVDAIYLKCDVMYGLRYSDISLHHSLSRLSVPQTGTLLADHVSFSRFTDKCLMTIPGY